jgi:hypothetical protein
MRKPVRYVLLAKLDVAVDLQSVESETYGSTLVRHAEIKTLVPAGCSPMIFGFK